MVERRRGHESDAPLTSFRKSGGLTRPEGRLAARRNHSAKVQDATPQPDVRSIGSNYGGIVLRAFVGLHGEIRPGVDENLRPFDKL